MGSPHTPEGYVWHIGIVMRALTSGNREEILECLEMLAESYQLKEREFSFTFRVKPIHAAVHTPFGLCSALRKK